MNLHRTYDIHPKQTECSHLAQRFALPILMMMLLVALVPNPSAADCCIFPDCQVGSNCCNVVCCNCEGPCSIDGCSCSSRGCSCPTTNADAASVINHFNEVDTDGSGSISLEEVKHWAKNNVSSSGAISGGSPSNVQSAMERFKAIDTDRSGVISFDEAKHWAQKNISPEAFSSFDLGFRDMDKNSNGTIEPAELDEDLKGDGANGLRPAH